MRAGQARRQLDLDEGGRSRILAPGKARQALRRGGDRDGVRREGPGRQLRRAGSTSLGAPTICSSTGSTSRPRTSSSTPTCSRSRPASTSTNNYAVDFIRTRRAGSSSTCRTPRSPGGISNVSFSFRGNDPVREAIHTVFLYHAIRAGLTMGIVNAGQLGVYDELDPELRERVEDVVLNRRADATERLVAFAETLQGARAEAGRGPRLARRHGGGAAVARAGEGHHDLHRRGHRGGAAASTRGRSR